MIIIDVFGISDPAFWLGLAVILAIVEAATVGLIISIICFFDCILYFTHSCQTFDKEMVKP